MRSKQPNITYVSHEVKWKCELASNDINFCVSVAGSRSANTGLGIGCGKRNTTHRLFICYSEQPEIKNKSTYTIGPSENKKNNENNFVLRKFILETTTLTLQSILYYSDYMLRYSSKYLYFSTF